MENIIINFSADTTQLKSALDILVKTGQVTENDAKQFLALGDASKKASTETGQAAKKTASSMEELGNKLKGIGAGIAAAFTVGAIVNFGKESFKAFEEAEKSATKLRSAVSANGGLISDFNKLIEQSAKLQKETIFSDESIQGAQTMALQFGLNREAVEKLIPAVADFASATGQDLNSALTSVIQGVNGMGRGLKVYGVEVSSTATRSENFTKVLDQLNNKFKGQAAIVADTAGGKLAVLANAWDDLKESIGGAISPLVAGAASLVKSLISITETPISEKLEQEQKALLTTTTALSGLNVGSDERVTIIKKLQQQYPDYLGNINAETVSNADLNAALDKVNNSLIVKIALQKSDEDIAKQQEKTGRALSDLAEARAKRDEELATIRKRANASEVKEKLDGIPVALQANELINSRIKLNGIASVSLANLSDAQIKVNEAELEFSKQQEKGDNLVKERIQKERDLIGIYGKQVEVKKKVVDPFDGKKSDADIAKEAADRKKIAEDQARAAKEAAEFKAKVDEENFKLALDNLDKFNAEEKTKLASKGLDSESLEKALTALNKQELDLRLQAYIDYGKATGDIDKAIADFKIKEQERANKDTTDLYNELLKEAFKNADEVTENEKEAADDRKKIRKANATLAKEQQEELFADLKQLTEGLFQAGIQETEERKTAALAADEEEINSLKRKYEEGHLSKKKYDAQLKALEDKKAADTKKLDADIAEQKRKQAIANKIIALFNIAIHTAESVMTTTAELGIFGLPAIPAIIALGAIQAGIVAAAPLPKLHKGRLAQGNSNEELAVVRKDETIFDPQQSREYAPTFRAIYHKQIRPSILNDYVSYKLKNQNTTFDTNKLAHDIAWALRDKKTDIGNTGQMADALADALVKKMPQFDPRKM